jgi:hypothetical protein
MNGTIIAPGPAGPMKTGSGSPERSWIVEYDNRLLQPPIPQRESFLEKL